MRVLALAVLVAIAGAAGGCFSPDAIVPGSFTCGGGGSMCPPDQECLCGRCWTDVSQAVCGDSPPAASDAPFGVDAPVIDAPVIDAPFAIDAPAIDAPFAIDAPLSTLDAPFGAPDAKLSVPDARPLPDAKLGTPDACVPDAPPGPVVDASVSQPDAPVCRNDLGDNCLTNPTGCGPCVCDQSTICALALGTNCSTCPQCHVCTCNHICQRDGLGTNDCVTCPSDCPGQCN